MKTNNHHQKSIHQHIEQLLRHRASVVLVLLLMFIGISSFDSRVRVILQEAYVQGWGWLATATHEHPPHTHMALNTVRVHTLSGPG